MNKKRLVGLSGFRRLASNAITLASVGWCSAIIIVVAVLLCGAIMLKTGAQLDLFTMDLCLSSECVNYWIAQNSAVFNILAGAGSLVTGMVTIGGILIALQSYQSSVRSSSITNHLSHLSLFISYVASELSRRSRIAASEVEALKWYHLVYDRSMSGVLSVSDEYSQFVARLNAQIERSNRLYSSVEDPGYRYREHQAEMISIVSEVGIYLERLPRIDFNEVEVQVLDLIQTINLSFCRDRVLPPISDRSYH